MEARVVFIATYDTKGEESEFIKASIEKQGVKCLTIDVGVGDKPRGGTPDVPLSELCQGSEYSEDMIREMPRGDAVGISSKLVSEYVRKIYADKLVSAVIGVGGAGGTQIVTQAMRTLPFGLPKLVLSTLASGNIRWYIQDSDIAMFPSIADVAGLNAITKPVFDRFAASAASAALWYAQKWEHYAINLERPDLKRIAMTMYGTTTKGVTRARTAAESKGYETVVFHASGAGGRAMEQFILDGMIHGVMDMTIAEIGGHLLKGLHDAGPHRLEAAVSKQIPMVLVPGAADTIVLPPLDEVPEKYKEGRVLNKHNPTMTTMRTNVEENIAIANFIADKLENASSKTIILIPKGGLSSIDKPGEVFYMPEANEALFTTLNQRLQGTKVQIIEDERHIYDPGFGERTFKLLEEMM